jgi:predicted transposase YbfD/YdcC
LLHPKKVGTLPLAGSEEQKQTNEIGMVIALLQAVDVCGRDITADALHTQRKLATYLVEQRQAHYFFSVKGNQPTLLADIALLFRDRGKAHFTQTTAGEHGRIETRRIWCSSALNQHLDFPHVGQVFLIERQRIDKKTGATTRELAYGITSRTAAQASPEKVLATNRAHWCIENSCHYALDWNYDEDRGRIRTGFGPENVSRLRRFAIGLIQSSSTQHSVAQTMRKLCRSPRRVFDYLRMTLNSAPAYAR